MRKDFTEEFIGLGETSAARACTLFSESPLRIFETDRSTGWALLKKRAACKRSKTILREDLNCLAVFPTWLVRCTCQQFDKDRKKHLVYISGIKFTPELCPQFFTVAVGKKAVIIDCARLGGPISMSLTDQIELQDLLRQRCLANDP